MRSWRKLAAARTAARSLGVRVIGTLGVVVRAKRNQYLPSAAIVLAQLTAAGIYLDDAVIRSVLQQVGETWPPAAPPDSPRPG